MKKESPGSEDAARECAGCPNRESLLQVVEEDGQTRQRSSVAELTKRVRPRVSFSTSLRAAAIAIEETLHRATRG